MTATPLTARTIAEAENLKIRPEFLANLRTEETCFDNSLELGLTLTRWLHFETAIRRGFDADAEVLEQQKQDLEKVRDLALKLGLGLMHKVNNIALVAEEILGFVAQQYAYSAPEVTDETTWDVALAEARNSDAFKAVEETLYTFNTPEGREQAEKFKEQRIPHHSRVAYVMREMTIDFLHGRNPKTHQQFQDDYEYTALVVRSIKENNSHALNAITGAIAASGAYTYRFRTDSEGNRKVTNKTSAEAYEWVFNVIAEMSEDAA